MRFAIAITLLSLNLLVACHGADPIRQQGETTSELPLGNQNTWVGGTSELPKPKEGDKYLSLVTQISIGRELAIQVGTPEFDGYFGEKAKVTLAPNAEQLEAFYQPGAYVADLEAAGLEAVDVDLQEFEFIFYTDGRTQDHYTYYAERIDLEAFDGINVDPVIQADIDSASDPFGVAEASEELTGSPDDGQAERIPFRVTIYPPTSENQEPWTQIVYLTLIRTN